ncbi:MAG: hypothetical protein HYT70_03140 [Candidatus Aenigmarchaeota archaeon]|nr:hypothetical protein [Candidatus Aenigmarchaeota archaeon]
MEKVEKTIKIKEEIYNRLNKYVGMLRVKERKPVSMNDAISDLLKREDKPSILSFAGTWSYKSDAEIKKLKKEIREVWKKWER